MSEKPGALEKVTGHLGTQLAATAVPSALLAYPGDPAGMAVVAAASVFPVLVNSLAGQRQKLRMQEWQQQVAQDLEAQKARLTHVTDAQYHLVNEVISAASQTINPQKLAYLRSAVRNSLLIENVTSQEASLLARLVRDISAPEADFVCQNFSYDYVCVRDAEQGEANTLTVAESSNENLIVMGLANLAVLNAVEDSNQFGDFGDGAYFTFSKMAAKLIALLRPATRENG